jgi:translocation and assembly module TamA
MRPFIPAFILFALCSAGSLKAAQLLPVKINGLDKQLEKDVRSVIALPESKIKGLEISEGRLGYYVNSLKSLVEDSLEPYGYYQAQVKTTLQRNQQEAQITIDIVLGEPVLVRQQNIQLQGAASNDRFMGFWLESFEPQIGDIFNHDIYETSKLDINQALFDRGYFDQNNTVHEVRVTRAENSADINLVWESGIRYRFGEVRFIGNFLEPSLIEQLVNFEQGKYYSQSQVFRLQESLSKLNYFGNIEIVPDLEHKQGEQVPILVTLTEGKQNSYNTSLRYGTQTGVGVEFGMERRWINSKGHKLAFDVAWAQNEQSFSANYRIPAFAWLDGWYAFGMVARNEEYLETPSRYVEAYANRSGEIGNWNLLGSINLRRERFDEFIPEANNATPIDLYTTALYPEFNAIWRSTTDIAFIENGNAWSYQARFGYELEKSQAWFVQGYVKNKRVISFSKNDRILLRTELGALWTENAEYFPPSLRFYGGGEQSIRGYGYKEIGDYVDGLNYGGQYLAIGSFEYERRILPDWAIASYVDVGDAFTNDFNINIGAGLGLRWRSPIGPVRFDVAYGFNGPDPGVAVYFNLGSDL